MYPEGYLFRIYLVQNSNLDRRSVCLDLPYCVQATTTLAAAAADKSVLRKSVLRETVIGVIPRDFVTTDE